MRKTGQTVLLKGNFILNWKYIFKPKNPNQKYFWKFACIFINAVIGWNFNILNVLGQIIFPSSTLSETDQ